MVRIPVAEIDDQPVGCALVCRVSKRMPASADYD
jgi:hypothetical protein